MLTVSLIAASAVLGSGGEASAKGEMQNLSSPAEVTENVVSGKAFQTAKMHVNARPEVVWRILTDYDNAEQIFLNLKDCQMLTDQGSTKIVKHEVRPTGWPGTFKYVLEVKESANRMLEWHRIRGDFREVDGYWKLEAADGGKHTLATYSAYINGGLFLPPPLVKRQIRVDMPVVLATLKKEAESRTQTQIAGRPEKRSSD